MTIIQNIIEILPEHFAYGLFATLRYFSQKP